LDQARYEMHLLMVDSTWENEMRQIGDWIACCLPVRGMNCSLREGEGEFTGGGVREREGWDESSGWLSEGPADIPR